MKRLLASTTLGLWCFLGTAGGDFVSTVRASVTGPLAQRLTGKPPAISVGGKSADEINAKIKSGQIKRVRPTISSEGIKETDDVEYGKGGGKPLLLDLFKPNEIKKPVPGLIFVHGGSWSHGTRKVYRYYCQHFAKTNPKNSPITPVFWSPTARRSGFSSCSLWKLAYASA